ncbi:MAG: NAD-dependent deacylase [Anaerolineae bacterium]|nr:NAD-dependent deacylase [Anaerolineae bacterium]
MNLEQQIQRAAQLIGHAHNIVAMTGAGISTPSGVPDFRSADSGLWDEVDPLSVASIHAFRQNPERFYHWIHPLARLLAEAEPNPAHYALAHLEAQSKLKAVITQNVDNLHRSAGSQTVYELHGHLREVTCTRCYSVAAAADLFQQFVETGAIPRCRCGGIFKPNAILFGEQLPMNEFVSARLAVEAADLMFIIGSSLEVAPASDLPEIALDNGIPVIIINQQPTFLDPRAELVIRGNVAEILPQVVELIAAPQG